MLATPSLLPDKTKRDFQQHISLRFNSVSKHFGKVLANDSISFDVESGSIHAIVGENGAGKSTLTKILYGYHKPDQGSIYLNDTKITLRSPLEAREFGIGMVHQQLALVPSLTGFENVLLGDPQLPFIFRRADLYARIAARAYELGFRFDLSCPIASLSIGERQKLEIFKLLWRNAQILVLDEPTSQLTPFEAADILTLARDLAAGGRIVILITHHINEVIQFAKRVTVLRKGKCITTADTEKLDRAKLARLMVDDPGKALPDRVTSKNPLSNTANTPLIKLKNLCVKTGSTNRALRQINLTINAGEVVGIAGISGSGQTELGQVLAGLLKPTSGDIIHMPDTPTYTGQASAQQRHGQQETHPPAHSICYIPADPKQAHAPGLSVTANCFLRNINSSYSHKLGILNSSLMQRQAQQLIAAFDIRPPLPQVPASTLSGSNLQRLIIARELATKAKVVVADNPCAGLDLAMSRRVRSELRQAASAGCGVVLISPDLEELIATCDRIAIMFNGCISGEQEAGQFDYQALALMMGSKA